MNKKNDNKIENIIFDLDGTLIDSLDSWVKIDLEFLHSRNCLPDSEYYENIAKLSFKEGVNFILKKYSINLSLQEACNEFYRLALIEYKNNIFFKEGALEYLIKLKENNVNLAIATSCPKECCMTILNKYKLSNYFKIISFTEEENFSKLQTEYYNMLLKKLNANIQNTIVYEDMFFAADSAQKAGINVIGVTNGDDNSNYNIELKKYCKRFIKNFNNEFHNVFF